MKDLASCIVPAVDRWLSWAEAGPEVAAGAVRAGPLRLIRVSAIANSSASSTSGVSMILMASEAVTCGDKMGGPGDVVGSVGALDSPSCGGVEAAEGAVTPYL